MCGGGGGGGGGHICPSYWFFDRSLVTGRALRLILYDFSMTYIAFVVILC